MTLPLLRPQLRFSGEFRSPELETAYWRFAWTDIRAVTCRTLLVLAFLIIVFFPVDIMALGRQPALYHLLAVRLMATAGIVLAALHIGRQTGYIASYPWIVLATQMGIAVTIWLLALLRQMPTAYLGVNTILCTLVFYQFLGNRFACTVFVNFFLGLGSILWAFVFLDMIATELVGSFFFLIPLNFLGITILRSINGSKRREFAALKENERIDAEKEKLIEELQTALAEVKTLQGFLPICAQCHKIRDDKGYWESIETYIQQRTTAKFSHSMCPDCAQQLYGRFLKKNTPTD